MSTGDLGSGSLHWFLDLVAYYWENVPPDLLCSRVFSLCRAGGSESDNHNNEGGDEAEEDEWYDDEYVPEWHEDDEDDFFSDDDESENLERDFSPFD